MNDFLKLIKKFIFMQLITIKFKHKIEIFKNKLVKFKL
jgi:hypothetical protein